MAVKKNKAFAKRGEKKRRRGLGLQGVEKAGRLLCCARRHVGVGSARAACAASGLTSCESSSMLNIFGQL
jgi:hypothetical protein